jgi:hypothetical protein
MIDCITSLIDSIRCGVCVRALSMVLLFFASTGASERIQGVEIPFGRNLPPASDEAMSFA